MTGDEFKIEITKAGIKQKDLPDIFKISLKTASNVCNATTVPTVYELALIGYMALTGRFKLEGDGNG